MAVLKRHTENAPGRIDVNRFADKARHARTAAGPFRPFASMSDLIRGDRSSSIEAEREGDSIDRILTTLACGDNDDVVNDDDLARRRCLIRAGSGANTTIDNTAAIRKEVRWRVWTVCNILESSSTSAAAASVALDAPPRDDDDNGRQRRQRQSTRLPLQRWWRQR